MGSERFPGDFPKPYEKRRYYTPDEVRAHDGNCCPTWVSYFGKVYDLTALLAEYPGPISIPITRAAGTDISHWFDPATRNPKTFVDAVTAYEEIYCPTGRYIHVPPKYPDTEFDPVDVPWWQEESKYYVGLLASSVRKLRIVNLLTKQQVEIEVPAEETLEEIQDRYLEHNRHCKSYFWKRLGKPLDLRKTLEENGIPDETKEFLALGMDPDDYVPAIHLYFSDDLTEA